jgi:hypothetical protein
MKLYVNHIAKTVIAIESLANNALYTCGFSRRSSERILKTQYQDATSRRLILVLVGLHGSVILCICDTIIKQTSRASCYYFPNDRNGDLEESSKVSYNECLYNPFTLSMCIQRRNIRTLNMILPVIHGMLKRAQHQDS